MAQQFVTTDGTLTIPGAYAKWKTAAQNSGLATNGILLIVGEADAGPSYVEETDLQDNSFGPDQMSDIIAKYGSGNLVDAARVASVPANDPAITGSPSRLILAKTNTGTKASAVLARAYGTVTALTAGKSGNNTFYKVTDKTAEVPATTGAFTWIAPVANVSADVIVNGVKTNYTVVAETTPAALVTQLGANASGGSLRTNYGDISGNASLGVNGNTVTIGLSVGLALAKTPVAGDTLIIAPTSALASAAGPSASGKNVGSYVITGTPTDVLFSAIKLSDAGKSGATAGSITAPEVVLSGAAGAACFKTYQPVTVAAPATEVPGIGKTLEIAEESGADLLSRYAFLLGTVTPVSWVSKTGAPVRLVSAAERAVTMEVNRRTDNVQEPLSAGGQIALQLGYTGTTAQAVVTATTITITRTGGAGQDIGVLTLSDFPTLSDLASFIASKTGYTATVGLPAYGQLPPTVLDQGTFACASSWGVSLGRIKMDAYKFFTAVSDSVLVTTTARAALGLPAVTSGYQYLTGGLKGVTATADVVGALTALEAVRGNFVCTCFSRDAASDIADGLTESGSTYAIADVNAAAKSHVLAMSTLRQRRNRQALTSIRDTFANAKTAAQTLASFRTCMTFQDVKAGNSQGSIVQFQPWMAAVDAAAMQAAGFYKAIFNKGANISGCLQAAGDFKDGSVSNVEDALLAGLMPLRRQESGGFRWVSDQTTYGQDSDFVLNSLQATYIADIVSMTLAERMENAFVGQSVADISAALAVAFVEAAMGDFMRLKLIAASDDAPRGFKNLSIRISGTAMVVSMEIKLAGAIYFIPIDFLMSPVVQTA